VIRLCLWPCTPRFSRTCCYGRTCTSPVCGPPSPVETCTDVSFCQAGHHTMENARLMVCVHLSPLTGTVGGAGAKAGLLVGDVITRVNKIPVDLLVRSVHPSPPHTYTHTHVRRKVLTPLHVLPLLVGGVLVRLDRPADRMFSDISLHSSAVFVHRLSTFPLGCL
jgi:hypothetical protein